MPKWINLFLDAATTVSIHVFWFFFSNEGSTALLSELNDVHGEGRPVKRPIALQILTHMHSSRYWPDFISWSRALASWCVQSKWCIGCAMTTCSMQITRFLQGGCIWVRKAMEMESSCRGVSGWFFFFFKHTENAYQLSSGKQKTLEKIYFYDLKHELWHVSFTCIFNFL